MTKNWKYYLAKTLDFINKSLRMLIFGIIIGMLVISIPLVIVGFLCLMAILILEDTNYKAKKWFNVAKTPEEKE